VDSSHPRAVAARQEPQEIAEQRNRLGCRHRFASVSAADFC
jgi:hypothetical protein